MMESAVMVLRVSLEISMPLNCHWKELIVVGFPGVSDRVKLKSFPSRSTWSTGSRYSGGTAQEEEIHRSWLSHKLEIRTMLSDSL